MLSAIDITTYHGPSRPTHLVHFLHPPPHSQRQATALAAAAAQVPLQCLGAWEAKRCWVGLSKGCQARYQTVLPLLLLLLSLLQAAWRSEVGLPGALLLPLAAVLMALLLLLLLLLVLLPLPLPSPCASPSCACW